MPARQPVRSILGHSVQGRPLTLIQLTHGSVPLLLLGGVHGDELEGYELAERLIIDGSWHSFDGGAALWAIPRVNPDGCALGQRMNANGVDLNRNLPTQDWTSDAPDPRYFPGSVPGSEVETQILITCIDVLQPQAIFSLHAWEACVNYNGSARPLAEAIAAHTGSPVTDDIGYPTPGSLGTWAGKERGIPTITLEIEAGSSAEQVWALYHPALMAGFNFCLRVDGGGSA